MFSKTLTLASKKLQESKSGMKGSTSGQFQDGQPATGDPQIHRNVYWGSRCNFLESVHFTFLATKIPMNFHFSFFFSTSQNLQSWKWTLYYLACCSGREWVNDKRSFDPDIFLLFFLTGFSNFMIVCIDGKLRGSKSPSNSILNCH